MMKLMALIIASITMMILYIISLTGFSSLYYFDQKKHTKIKIYGNDKVAYKLALFQIILYYVSTILMAFYIKIIIGIIVILMMTLIAIKIRNYIQNSMENISEIHCGFSGPIYIKFKKRGKHHS